MPKCAAAVEGVDIWVGEEDFTPLAHQDFTLLARPASTLQLHLDFAHRVQVDSVLPVLGGLDLLVDSDLLVDLSA